MSRDIKREMKTREEAEDMLVMILIGGTPSMHWSPSKIRDSLGIEDLESLINYIYGREES